jgi:hypothetical protein
MATMKPSPIVKRLMMITADCADRVSVIQAGVWAPIESSVRFSGP